MEEEEEHRAQPSADNEVITERGEERIPFMAVMYKEVHDSLNLVSIECEKELSTFFRTGDKRRKAFLIKLEEQIEIAEQKSRVILESSVCTRGDLGGTQIDSETWEILAKAGLMSPEKLERCLDKYFTYYKLIAKIAACRE